MEAKVLKRFKNKYSKRTHEVGEHIEVTKKRFEEINSTKHGKMIEEIKQPDKAGD